MLRHVRLLLLVAFSISLCAPAVAGAATIRSGDSVIVDTDEVIEGDLVAFAGNIEIRGKVTGDVVAFGGNVTISGEVGGDLLSGAGQTRITGPVHGSVRSAGGQITIETPIGQDALLAAGRVELSKKAGVGSDLLLAAGDAQLVGKIGGDVQAAAGSLRLDSVVDGNVRAETGTLSLGEDAAIAGNLRYRSDERVVIPAGVVAGTVERLTPRQEPSRPLLPVLGWIRAIVGLFALGLLLMFLWPSFSMRSVATLRASPWLSLLAGVVALVIVPFAAIVVIGIGALLGGWWIGIIGLAMLGIAAILAFPISALSLGRELFSRIQEQERPVLALLVGLAILTLLVRVPILGVLVALAVVCFGLGAMTIGALRKARVIGDSLP